jgi:hypothetical protein
MIQDSSRLVQPAPGDERYDFLYWRRGVAAGMLWARGWAPASILLGKEVRFASLDQAVAVRILVE